MSSAQVSSKEIAWALTRASNQLQLFLDGGNIGFVREAKAIIDCLKGDAPEHAEPYKRPFFTNPATLIATGALDAKKDD